jgi:hypothetical protein
LIVGLQPTAWPSGPSVIFSFKSRRRNSNPLRPRYKGGARPVEHGRPFEQPVLVLSQLDRGSEPQSPPEGLAGKDIKRVWIAGYDPAPRRSQGRMQSHYTISTISQYPRQESNLICDLRIVACAPAHSEDILQ